MQFRFYFFEIESMALGLESFVFPRPRSVGPPTSAAAQSWAGSQSRVVTNRHGPRKTFLSQQRIDWAVVALYCLTAFLLSNLRIRTLFLHFRT